MPKVLDNLDYKAMLEEAQSYYNSQIRSFDVLRDHAKTILGVASVLVSIFATFGKLSNSISQSGYYGIIIISIVIIYIWLIIKSLVGVIPRRIHYPIFPEYEEYKKAFLGKDEKDIIKQKLSNYLNIIPKNEMIIQERRSLEKLITIQLAIIVVLILISTFVQTSL